MPILTTRNGELVIARHYKTRQTSLLSYEEATNGLYEIDFPESWIEDHLNDCQVGFGAKLYCRQWRLSLPQYIQAFLDKIEHELDRIMWNINQEEYDSPFRNSGNVDGFVCDTFEAHAYEWDYDNEPTYDYNFKYKDIEITWYKHSGRGTCINRYITPDEAITMLNDCLGALLRYEQEHEHDI